MKQKRLHKSHYLSPDFNKALQWTMSMIRLLTDGGTPLEAMHKYGPMCSRFTRVMLKTLPSIDGAEIIYGLLDPNLDQI